MGRLLYRCEGHTLQATYYWTRMGTFLSSEPVGTHRGIRLDRPSLRREIAALSGRIVVRYQDGHDVAERPASDRRESCADSQLCARRLHLPPHMQNSDTLR